MIKKIENRVPKQKMEIPKIINDDIGFYLITGWVHRASQDRAIELLHSRRYTTQTYDYEYRGSNKEGWE